MTAERLKGCRAGRRGAWRSGLMCLLSTGSAPPPPCFSSVHHSDHSFFFSFSIFRYPRVPRKKGQTVPKSHLQNAGAATRSTKGPSSARPCSWGKNGFLLEPGLPGRLVVGGAEGMQPWLSARRLLICLRQSWGVYLAGQGAVTKGLVAEF